MTEESRAVVASTEYHGRRAVLRLHGELDVANRHVLRRELNAVLEQDPQTLEVDLTGLGFADCSSLSVLASAQMRLAEHGHQLIIIGAQPMVRRLLAVTGLDAFFRFSEAATQGHDGRAEPAAGPKPPAAGGPGPDAADLETGYGASPGAEAACGWGTAKLASPPAKTVDQDPPGEVISPG
jgi:anti-anti-sigma factor